MGSIIRLAPLLDKDGNATSEYDQSTRETITRYSAALLDEDFIGPSHTAGIPASATVGYPWVTKLTGTATVAAVANSPGGVVQNAIPATSAAQEAALYAGDVLNWDASKSANFETRLAVSVLPTGIAEIVFGLRAAWNAIPDSVATYIDFQLLGSGVVNARIKDGVTSAQSQLTGVTLVASAYHNFRFDTSDPTNVLFYIDGARVGGNLTTKFTFAATGAAAVLQPYFSVYKLSGTDVGTILIDSVQVGMNRS